jgi:hypothetical protein
VKHGPGWYDTDPEALRLAEEVFSEPWPPGLGLGALTGPARTASPKESALEELPLTANSPQESFPQDNSPRASSSWEENGSGFTLGPAVIANGQLDVKALNADEQFIRAVGPLLGVAGLHASAPCCLPGGNGNATFTRSKRNHYLYTCPCHGGGKGRSVTDAYAAKTSGRIKRRTGDVYFIWTIRLLAAAGAVVPSNPWLPSLPTDADESTITVYDGLVLFLGLRALTAFPPEFTFSRSFAMDWCQLAEDPARAGIEAIREAKIIEKVGVTDKRAYLYRIGGGA